MVRVELARQAAPRGTQLTDRCRAVEAERREWVVWHISSVAPPHRAPPKLQFVT